MNYISNLPESLIKIAAWPPLVQPEVADQRLLTSSPTLRKVAAPDFPDVQVS